MEHRLSDDQRYFLAKKRVEKIAGFYWHFIVYVIVNIVLSGVIIYGLVSSNSYSFEDAFSNFGVYSTWLFWGIGVFFHWLGVFGFNSLLSSDWEQRKIKELMDKEEHKTNSY